MEATDDWFTPFPGKFVWSVGLIWPNDTILRTALQAALSTHWEAIWVWGEFLSSLKIEVQIATFLIYTWGHVCPIDWLLNVPYITLTKIVIAVIRCNATDASNMGEG